MVIQVTDIRQFKQKALQWASSFDVCCYLDSNQFEDKYSKFDTLIAAGVNAEITAESGRAFEALADFKSKHNQWMTGFLSYDLKNEIEQLHSNNVDNLQFPDLYFFVPQHLIVIKADIITIESPEAGHIFNAINAINAIKLASESAPAEVNIRARLSRQQYLDSVKEIKEHISRGDIYVTNFCQEFYAEEAVIDPLEIFSKLNQVSPNPFSCFFKYYDKYILCASPERFLAKRGSKLISQPIKGTARRERDEQADDLIKQQLRKSTKEQQENVMIVDLVRNDLTRSAKQGTVEVEELFGVYSFKQVHQMISTVVCEFDEHLSTIDAVKNTFPMGSMTGAPKVKAMQLMEHYERSKRGIYSGAIGYFSQDGDFDFNVVIRTILYNATNRYLSFQAGSAITYHADPVSEYEECLLKIKAILEVLGQQKTTE